MSCEYQYEGGAGHFCECLVVVVVVVETACAFQFGANRKRTQLVRSQVLGCSRQPAKLPGSGTVKQARCKVQRNYHPFSITG